MKIVIWTVPSDIHARAVEWVLRKRGIDAEVYLASDFPTQKLLSVSGRNNSLIGDSCDDSNYPGLGADVLWRRREGLPVFSDAIHESDVDPARNEAKQFIDGMNCLLDSGAAFSANPYHGSRLSRSKIHQLRVAQCSGFAIPPTLISNDPGRVSDFCDEYDGDVIVKSFTSPSWVTEEHCYFVYSRRVSSELLSSPESIKAVPSIYQVRVKKSYEVRAFFAGSRYLAAKINSQSIEKTRDDWRALGGAKKDIEPILLPDDVVASCLKFLETMGINCGSFDFAVDHDGQYVFFEINEQGQFLWLENDCPDIPALTFFADHLQSMGKCTAEPHVVEGERLTDFLASEDYRRVFEEEESIHVKFERTAYLEDGASPSLQSSLLQAVGVVS